MIAVIHFAHPLSDEDYKELAVWLHDNDYTFDRVPGSATVSVFDLSLTGALNLCDEVMFHGWITSDEAFLAVSAYRIALGE